MKKVYIKWIDSCSLSKSGWNPEEDIKQLYPETVHSIGYIFKETKKYITLVAHLGEYHSMGEICIPKSAIRKRKKINVK